MDGLPSLGRAYFKPLWCPETREQEETNPWAQKVSANSRPPSWYRDPRFKTLLELTAQLHFCLGIKVWGLL